MSGVASGCHAAAMTKDRRLGVTILVFLIVFIGSSLLPYHEVLVRAVLAGLCAGLAWVVTPKPRS